MDEHRESAADVRAENSGITAGGGVSVATGGGDFAGRDLFKIGQLKLYTVAAAREEDDRRRDGQHRARLVTRVCRDYGQRLTQALDKAIRIELDLDETPAALYQQLDIAAPRELATRRLPAGTDVAAVYRESGGRNGSGLLVLGEPGAGKTTAILELARDLAADAKADDDPVPVYVPLSSWTVGRRPGERPAERLAEWLAHEVHELYQLPLATAQRWVGMDRLLPVLDGLDEITDLDDRADCLTAINAFAKEHALPVVLASRQHDYFQLVDAGYRVADLGTAISIAALDPEAVLGYLAAAGPTLAGVRAAVAEDPELLDMCRSPLLLSILVLTYSAATREEVAAVTGAGHRRSQLFTDYVATRFERAARAQLAGARAVHRERSTGWLTMLAAGMERHGQTVFLLDRLQYDWLPGRFRRALARLIPTVLFFLLVLALSWVTGALDTGVVAPAFYLLSACGIAFATAGGEIRLVERMAWSWRAVQAGLWQTLLIAVITAAAATGLIWLLIGPVVQLWLLGLLTVMGSCCGGVLADGFQTALGSVTRAPNEGLNNSFGHGVRSGLTGGVLFGALGGAFLAATVGPTAGIRGGISLGLTGMAFIGLVKGLGAALQHVVVRAFLWRTGRAPLGYAAWLETMVRMRLLYRMGGGYVFIHRFLQEFFAEGNTDTGGPGRIPVQAPAGGD